VRFNRRRCGGGSVAVGSEESKSRWIADLGKWKAMKKS